ncbi:hypothetical protein QY97_00382 [Bacillus thermotolerans]|uniref:Uncharacterized protein n=1 Tax=Bacillus thermotolerans TaxID=1221996 RepID=A0A0F5HWJ3_BACTR|nr:hypothetical protein QY97_00382 [Bacillus thermotolerans]KKB42987.1 hypothetical protein QY95_03094 [Bacillus thermotolerans]KKB43894.1 hypothetical protein QY96_00489 [Bacillus thermotolerans]
MHYMYSQMKPFKTLFFKKIKYVYLKTLGDSLIIRVHAREKE